MRYLTCPVCSQPLSDSANSKSLSCSNKHLFDKAKQGYINLLLSHQKKSKQPGDTTEMVSARTRFLDRGYYQVISQSLASIVNESIVDSEIKVSAYCDLACGEGYYTNYLRQNVNAISQSVITGFDISTPAIKAATKRNKDIQWLVASNNNIPIATNSQDILTSLFCRVDFESTARIAKQGGIFIIAETGAHHLIELRELLYDEINAEKPKMDKALIESSGYFEFINTVTTRSVIQLKDSQDIMDLLTMTPHFWRVKSDKKNSLGRVNSLETTLDIRFHILKRK